LDAALIALMPAALSASCVLVTTSTFGGSAGAAFFWRADAVTGSISTTARLSRAGPRTLDLIPLPLRDPRVSLRERRNYAHDRRGVKTGVLKKSLCGSPNCGAVARAALASQGWDLISGAAPIGGFAALGLHAAPCRYAHSLRCACSRLWP
jgi:hypothetical protein